MAVLSVLDQGPVRSGDGPAAALRDTLTVAAGLDGGGFARYWVAEHHDAASRAIAAPEILVGALATATSQLRVGAGGMMLPNHTPLHVAEQFRTLNALHPGRIDLGIGRATGSADGAVAAALSRGGADPAAFERALRELLGFGGARDLPAGAPPGVVAAPADVPLPPVHLLGASASSADLAARLGLPYALTAGFRDPAIAVATLRRYRERFEPAGTGGRPHAILVLRAWVGVDDEHATALAAPERLANIRQLAGFMAALVPPEQALAHRYTDAERAVADRVDLRADLVGTADRVAARLTALAAESRADEVMVVANTYAVTDRLASLRRLAAAFGQPAVNGGHGPERPVRSSSAPAPR